ncbi:MAG: peptidoglycan-binding domain-containing protein, partial [Cyanobacteria bacterium J06649_11]
MNGLKFDDRSRKVEELQNHLKTLGFYEGETDGWFGIVTENAVKEFQQQENIFADGVVDGFT